MPFGLHNALSTFQRLMDVVLQGTSKFTRCSIHDISIFSQSWTDHLVHLREVLSKLERAGLTLQLKKCTFGSDYCEFLGYQVGASKITPQNAKAEALANYQQPQTKTDIRSFLGLAGYYRRYIQTSVLLLLHCQIVPKLQHLKRSSEQKTARKHLSLVKKH